MTPSHPYDEYTTRGHGAIEGYHGTRSRGVTATGFVTVSNIPDCYNCTQVRLDIYDYIKSGAGIKNSNQDGIVLRSVVNDINNGLIIKLHDSYIKYNADTGSYEVYTMAKKVSSKNKRQLGHRRNTKPETDEIYARLLKIQQDAADRRGRIEASKGSKSNG